LRGGGSVRHSFERPLSLQGISTSVRSRGERMPHLGDPLHRHVGHEPVASPVALAFVLGIEVPHQGVRDVLRHVSAAGTILGTVAPTMCWSLRLSMIPTVLRTQRPCAFVAVPLRAPNLSDLTSGNRGEPSANAWTYVIE
jgi:hypothetical protein